MMTIGPVPDLVLSTAAFISASSALVGTWRAHRRIKRMNYRTIAITPETVERTVANLRADDHQVHDREFAELLWAALSSAEQTTE